MNKEILAKSLLNKIKLVAKRNFKDIHIPDLTSLDSKSVNKTIKKNFVSTYGPYRQEFEEKLKKITKAKYVLAVNSGTTALQLAIKSLNLPKNSEILMPSLTFAASANSAIYNNLKPHFVDTEKNNFGIDFDKLDKYLEKIAKNYSKFIVNKKTNKQISAIMPVHLFGHSVNCKKLKNIAKKFKLKIIEDAAEALGSKYQNKHLGIFGEVGCLSFNGNKIITTGDGGALVTNSELIYNRAFYYANIAKKKSSVDLEHGDVGYNFLMPNLNASLGISQLNRLNKYVSNKRELYKKYSKEFKSDKYFKLYKDQSFEKSNYWLQTILINEEYKNYKNFFIKYLRNNNIGCRPVWKCMHMLKPYKNFPRMKLDNTVRHFSSIINIPSSYNIF